MLEAEEGVMDQAEEDEQVLLGAHDFLNEGLAYEDEDDVEDIQEVMPSSHCSSRCLPHSFYLY